MADKQFGGWYNNPDAGGKNMRWWGSYGWTNGEDPTQGGGSSSTPTSSNNTSSGGGGGSSSSLDANSILQGAIDAVTAMLPKPVAPYETVNPFFFDEALAKEASTAEYAPYYQEMLTDYISTAERTKSRSAEDTSKLLNQLEAGKEYYMGKSRLLLDKALKSTNEGYAGRGLFFSGARGKDVQDIQKENQMDVENYMGTYKYDVGQAETANKRVGENITTGVNNYTRDIEREKKYAIATGVEQRETEVRDEYEASRQKYYQNAGYSGLYGGMYG